MKIICIGLHANKIDISLKPETALSVNNKPFFVPPFTSDIRFRPCQLFRISRLGRNIEQRFASRYYDACGIGLNFVAYDGLSQARKQGEAIAAWTAFDNSLPISHWTSTDNQLSVSKIIVRLHRSAHAQIANANSLIDNQTSRDTSNIASREQAKDEEQMIVSQWSTTIENAIATSSQYFKLCTGDIIAIDADCEQIEVGINDQIDLLTENEILDMSIRIK